MLSTRLLKGPTSKEQALMNLGVTALMVETLSKRAQLLSSLILTQAMFSGRLQWVSGSWFKKGAFWDILRLKELQGMLAEWLLVSEGSSLPSLSPSLSCLNSISRQSYWGFLDNPSWDGQGYHIWNNFDFPFSTTWLRWQNKQHTQQTDPFL